MSSWFARVSGWNADLCRAVRERARLADRGAYDRPGDATDESGPSGD
ncbi:hypothetical protein [Halomicrobium sp. LC1Hm]|nr:hypothetical protein [Halomicrobium sp. LC1Hm]